MAQERPRYGRDGIEFGRALTFFDAVFAFALTLLVTSIDDFSPEAWRSPGAFWAANGSSLLSFAISFVVVVSFWRSSHRQLAEFRHLDSGLIGIQALAMFGVVLIPFTTEAMGKPALNGLPLPVAVYAVDVSVTYLLQHAVPVVADRRGLRTTRMSPAEHREILATAVVLPAVFLGSIPVAYLVSPGAAQLSWLLLFVLVPLAGRLARGAPEQ